MLKKIFNKVDHFIQWTKKWHFFHVFFVPNAIFALLNLFISIFLYILDICFLSSTKTFIFSFNHLLLMWEMYTFLAIVFFILATFVQIVFLIISMIKHKNIQLQNQILLNNKKYNILYCIAFYCNVLYLCSLLFLIVFSFISIIIMMCVADKIMY